MKQCTTTDGLDVGMNESVQRLWVPRRRPYQVAICFWLAIAAQGVSIHSQGPEA